MDASSLLNKHKAKSYRNFCKIFFNCALPSIASTWRFTGWCELRGDFRSFRLDRMANLVLLDEAFEDEAGLTLKTFLQRVREA